MEWETEKSYRERRERMGNVFDVGEEELITDDKAGAFARWLEARPGLALVRKIPTFWRYEFTRSAGMHHRLCQDSEAFMRSITPKVIRRWGGEWRVFGPSKDLDTAHRLTWEISCVRLAADEDDDPTVFTMARCDDECGLPCRSWTPKKVPAALIGFRLPERSIGQRGPNGRPPLP